MSALLLSVIFYIVSSLLFALRTFLWLELRYLPSGMLVLALFLYLIHFFTVYTTMGRFPVGDMYGMVSLTGNFLTLLFLTLDKVLKKSVADFGFMIALIGFLTTLLGLPAEKVGYKNPFYVYHILSAGVAYASLILGGASSGVKFLVERKLKSKHIEGFMVPVNLLRKMEKILLNVGFIFLTLTLIFGSLWAKSFLGKHWINDYKLTLTLGLWVYYAIVIHINLVKGIKPTRFSLLSLLGLIMTLGSMAFIRHSVE
ncbi:MAG TPA: cytochrome C biogenesis protein [Aquificaceae bacterium]|nr:cytochrome C biogenesis protein [Aquificaceae bacterium]